MRFPLRAMFLLSIAAHLLSGCAWLPSQAPPDLPPAAKPVVKIEEIPFFSQTLHQCGPAALAMVLNWSGVPATPDQLVPMVYTPGRKGTLQPGLISGARRHERLAYPIEGLPCLIEELSAGHPVIVLQNLGLNWLPRWHYAVVTGYDLRRNAVRLHTGTHSHRWVGLRTFLRTWRRADQWGLLVLPVETMPACAEVHPYLMAALGLQQAGFPSSARKAYGAAAEKWPQSIEAQMAWGNSLYESGSVSEARAVFERAVRIEPGNGMVLNNLAHVLAETGNLTEAANLARRAVAAGGPQLALFRQTLEEILHRIQTPGVKTR